MRKRKFADSPLEGNGFETPVPREIGSGCEASVGLGPRADRPSARRYHPSGRRPRQADRAVPEARGATTHRRMKAPTVLPAARGIAEPEFRIQFPPAKSQRTIGSATVDLPGYGRNRR
jgi:hypothetical protein